MEPNNSSAVILLGRGAREGDGLRPVGHEVLLDLLHTAHRVLAWRQVARQAGRGACTRQTAGHTRSPASREGKAWPWGGAHVPQKTANFGNKDRQNRPHGDDYLLGSVSPTVPENRSVVSELPSSVVRGIHGRGSRPPAQCPIATWLSRLRQETSVLLQAIRSCTVGD